MFWSIFDILKLKRYIGGQKKREIISFFA